MEYTIKELADLAGVSTRTLRWYDQKGLLKPYRVNEANYRFYGDDEVKKLQQILFYRELGFSLCDIEKILKDPNFDDQKALQSHLMELTKRRERIDALILTVKKTLEERQGGRKMSDREKFEAFKKEMIQQNEKKYGEEIRKKYGDKTVDEANAAAMKMSMEQYEQWENMGRKILGMLRDAVLFGKKPDSEEGKNIVELHRKWGFRKEKYDPKKYIGIVSLYTMDERFTQYYDSEVPGCAQFLTDAAILYKDGAYEKKR